MITIADLARMLSLEHELIHEQTHGLSQADTLIQPQPSGNCMNWVLGHLVENQISMLAALGGSSPVPADALARYQRESEPVRGDEPGLLTLETLLEYHDRVHAAVMECLGAMSEAEFMQEIQYGERKVTRGWRVFFLQFHYTYHIGQLELLRQLAGRTEKII